MPETMTFSEALAELKRGRRVTRRGWNGPDQYIEIQDPDADSKMSLSYIYIRTAQGDFVPWTPSQTDLLASDWDEAPVRFHMGAGEGPPADEPKGPHG